jgi:hypothetical protein
MRTGWSTLQDRTDIFIIIKFQQYSLLSITNSLIKINGQTLSSNTISGNDSGVFFYQGIPINA